MFMLDFIKRKKCLGIAETIIDASIQTPVNAQIVRFP